MVSVCKQEDSFLHEKPIWFVDLSNGERIWMDDDRPGASPKSAWRRLGAYIAENQVAIARMYIKFRSHLECPVPDNAKGYFFSHKAVAYWGSTATMTSFLVGFFDGEGIHVQEWKVPELIQTHIEYRKPQDLKEPACLILNPGVTVPLMENT